MRKWIESWSKNATYLKSLPWFERLSKCQQMENIGRALFFARPNRLLLQLRIRLRLWLLSTFAFLASASWFTWSARPGPRVMGRFVLLSQLGFSFSFSFSCCLLGVGFGQPKLLGQLGQLGQLGLLGLSGLLAGIEYSSVHSVFSDSDSENCSSDTSDTGCYLNNYIKIKSYIHIHRVLKESGSRVSWFIFGFSKISLAIALATAARRDGGRCLWRFWSSWSCCCCCCGILDKVEIGIDIEVVYMLVSDSQSWHK